MNEIWFLSWVLTVEAVALAVLPLTVRLLRALPDRGFLLSKPLGILILGYVCWLPAVLGLIRFQRAVIVSALLLVAIGSWLAWGKEAIKLLSSLRALLFAMEALFLLALVGASVIRAFSPDISGTEKPMDFAFLNGIIRSDTLPPEDPWMAGYGISYYYFGYYLLGVISKLSAVPPSVAYNLSVALIFSLLLAGSFSLAFNLLSAIRPAWRLPWRLAASLVAPVVVGIMGNLEIALEVLASKGYSNPAFWQWVGIKNLQPAAVPDGWFPTSFWWWWRASRVIPTTTPDGINEFPFFSFLLGDLHPHFTASPWVLLAVSVSLATVLTRADGLSMAKPWPSRLLVALVLGFPLVGNSWDFPTCTGLYWLAVLVPLGRDEWNREAFRRSLGQVALVSALSVGLYAPFFLGFSSQTRGIGVSADRTPLASLIIIFGAVLVGLLLFLSWRGWRAADEISGDRAPRVLVLSGAGMAAISAGAGALALIGGVVLLCVSAAVRFYRGGAEPPRERAATLFQLLMIAAGIALILVPEFLFLNDLFGTRMNTVFKFHYQAWQLLGIAVSVGVAWLVASARRWLLRGAIVVVFALPVVVGLLYPVAATASRIQDFASRPTLDGAAFYRSLRPDDYAAIQWISRDAADRPVVLEATGGSYTEFARVSTFSGLPTVLGWAAHEAQWGRSGAELTHRAQDIDAIYSTASRDAMLTLLHKYQVRYVFVGTLEVEKYGAVTANRFAGVLEPAFRQGVVAVYRVPT